MSQSRAPYGLPRFNTEYGSKAKHGGKVEMEFAEGDVVYIRDNKSESYRIKTALSCSESKDEEGCYMGYYKVVPYDQKTKKTDFRMGSDRLHVRERGGEIAFVLDNAETQAFKVAKWKLLFQAGDKEDTEFVKS